MADKHPPRFDRRITTLALLLSWSLAFALAPGLRADDDASQARELVKSGIILPLSHFIEAAQRHHPGHIIEAELEYEAYHGGHGYVYEIEILDANGQVWELEFHAETGELLEKEREDD